MDQSLFRGIKIQAGTKKDFQYGEISLETGNLGRNLSFRVAPNGWKLEATISKFRGAVGKIGEQLISHKYVTEWSDPWVYQHPPAIASEPLGGIRPAES